MNKFAGHGVKVVAVSVAGTEAAVRTWMLGLGVTDLPAIQDPGTIFPAYSPGYYAIPHSYIIGRDMIIRKDLLGLMAESVMEGHLLDVIYMRNPIDLEMIMDVSDTMNDPPPSLPGGDSKLVLMKQAASIITDFLNDHGQADDRMGLIWFSDDVSEYENPAGDKLLPIPANWAELRAQINAHGTGICTAMGSGLQTAFHTLTPSTNQRFAILCTDGMQNIEPKVAPAGGHLEIIDSGGWLCGGHSSVTEHPGVNIASYNTRVHTIGIGIEATYASLLQDIANATGGFYRGTNDPETDLDLIYIVDLCNCMAGGSPAVIHHNTGTLHSHDCEVTEDFCVNRAVRKITVMLSWQKAEKGNLTFWLYGPDGTLLNLHSEMKLFESHCLATVYLPKEQDGRTLPHTGQWKMVIRGETPGSSADYHAFVIAEDRDTHYHVDFPRKVYEVGDILPVRIKITEKEKPIGKIRDIIMETAHLRVSPAELMAQYKISEYELLQRKSARKSGKHKDPVQLKLAAMESEPRFRELLKPIRTVSSLAQGSLECKISDNEIIVPVALNQAGLLSCKIKIRCETPQNGPFCRTEMVSVYVGPGKADPQKTRVNLLHVSEHGLAGAQFHITLKNGTGQLIGPGLGRGFRVCAGEKDLEVRVEDGLDGTYRLELSPHKVKPGDLKVPLSVIFQDTCVWNGKLKGGESHDYDRQPRS